MDIFEELIEELIVEELFLQHEATEEEKQFVLQCIEKTGNIWDVGPLVAIYRTIPDEEKRIDCLG